MVEKKGIESEKNPETPKKPKNKNAAQPTKKELEDLALQKGVQDGLLRYVEQQVIREQAHADDIISSGQKYEGILSTLQAQLKRLQDGSYWPKVN